MNARPANDTWRAMFLFAVEDRTGCVWQSFLSQPEADEYIQAAPSWKKARGLRVAVFERLPKGDE